MTFARGQSRSYGDTQWLSGCLRLRRNPSCLGEIRSGGALAGRTLVHAKQELAVQVGSACTRANHRQPLYAGSLEQLFAEPTVGGARGLLVPVHVRKSLKAVCFSSCSWLPALGGCLRLRPGTAFAADSRPWSSGCGCSASVTTTISRAQTKAETQGSVDADK